MGIRGTAEHCENLLENEPRFAAGLQAGRKKGREETLELLKLAMREAGQLSDLAESRKDRERWEAVRRGLHCVWRGIHTALTHDRIPAPPSAHRQHRYPARYGVVTAAVGRGWAFV